MVKASKAPNPCGHLVFKESCVQCKALQKGWYDYLTYSGFEDIEKDDKALGFVKPIRVLESHEWHNDTQRDQKTNYYVWAEQKRDDGNFKNTFPQKDRLIWEYHYQGISTRAIAKQVGYRNHSNVSRKIKTLQTFLRTHEISSGSSQMDLFFWSDHSFTG